MSPGLRVGPDVTLAEGWAVFAALPTPYMLLTPALVIHEVNRAYAHATMRQRDELVGQSVFDAFPDNPADTASSLYDERERAEGLARALQSRVIIEQAKGVLAERYDVDPSTAFEALRAHARRTRHSIHDVATDVVVGTLDIDVSAAG